jgi:hypothetical protein
MHRRPACCRQPGPCNVLFGGCVRCALQHQSTCLFKMECGLICRVRKTIIDFPKWSTEHLPQSSAEPAFDVLTSVYTVCDATSGSLVQTVTPPKLSRKGTYRVELQLCGPDAQPRTAEVTCYAMKSQSWDSICLVSMISQLATLLCCDICIDISSSRVGR